MYQAVHLRYQSIDNQDDHHIHQHNPQIFLHNKINIIIAYALVSLYNTIHVQLYFIIAVQLMIIYDFCFWLIEFSVSRIEWDKPVLLSLNQGKQFQIFRTSRNPNHTVCFPNRVRQTYTFKSEPRETIPNF